MGNIKLMDCTLGDGGHVNNWNFGEYAIHDIVNLLRLSRIDFIELGHLKKLNNNINNGAYSIYDDIGDASDMVLMKQGSSQYTVTVDSSDFLTLKILEPRLSDSIVDIIRIVIHKKNYKKAFNYCKGISQKGYLLCIVPTRTFEYTKDEFIRMVEMYSQLDLMAFYVSDDFGVMSTAEILEYTELADQILKPEVALGLRINDNLTSSFEIAKVFAEKVIMRNKIIDASVRGIGKYAGNLQTELIAKYLNDQQKKSYRLQHLETLYTNYLQSLHYQKKWGYKLQYYSAAYYKCNPEYASYYTDIMLTPSEISQVLAALPEKDKKVFSKDKAEEHLKNYRSAYWSKKLCVVVLTRDRPKSIEFWISTHGKRLTSYGIDLIFYDSSSDDRTEAIVKNYIADGFDTIHYSRYEGTDNNSLDEKIIAAYRKYSSKYEYIWLCRDGIVITFDFFHGRLQKLLDKRYDLVIIDSYWRDINGSGNRRYNNCVELFKDQCIRMVTLGTMIVSSRFIIDMIDKIPVDMIKNYSLWQAIAPFEYYANHKVNAVSLTGDVFIYNPNGTPSSFWNSSGKALWQWAERWYNVIMNLPKVYDNEKANVLKIKMCDFDPFGIRQLLIIRSNGGLRLKDIRKNKQYITHVTETAIWKFYALCFVPVWLVRYALTHKDKTGGKLLHHIFRGLKKLYHIFRPAK